MDEVAFYLIIGGLLIVVIGIIGMLIDAFREGILWFLLMFVPFGALAFIILKWKAARSGFLLQLLGLVIFYGSYEMILRNHHLSIWQLHKLTQSYNKKIEQPVIAITPSKPKNNPFLTQGTILICQRPIKAFRPDEPTSEMGEFKTESPLVIGKLHSSGKLEVSFTQPDGKKIEALCNLLDLTYSEASKQPILLVPGSTFICKKPVPAFSVDDAAKVLGEFKKDTPIVLGQPHVSGKIFVSYQPPNGQAISALCLPSDLNIPEVKIDGWTTDLNLAQKVASEQKKMVLMDFTGSDWCGWCMKLDEEVFRTPQFQSYARENLVLLKVDFPHGFALSPDLRQQNNMLQAKYGVQGYPTIVLCNSTGNEVGRLGYRPGGPSVFLDALKMVAHQ